MTSSGIAGARTWAFALLAAWAAAGAQPATSPDPSAGGRLVADPGFDHVIVVATKRESRIRDVAADVTVVSDADLRATLATSIADAFRYLPGVSHAGAGSRFGSESIVLRGIGGNRVAIELDGVPFTEQFDIGRFSNATRDVADTALVGQVEVLRGPASALYGSSALGGVVAMRTPDPRQVAAGGGLGGFGAAVYRSLDESSHAQARLAAAGANAAALIAVSSRTGNESDSAALREPTDWRDYRQNSVLLKFVGASGARHDWQISAIHQDGSVETGISSVLGSGRFRSTTRLEGDDRSEASMLSAEYRFRPRDGLLDGALARVFAADSDIRQRTLDERANARRPVRIDRDFFYEQRIHGAEVNLWHNGQLGGWDHHLGVGFEWTERRTEELRDGVSLGLEDAVVSRDILGERFPLRDFPISRTRELGAYVSDQLSRGGLSLIFALRYDHNRLSPLTDPVYAEDNPSIGTVAVSASDFSPKFGAIYRFSDDVDVYVQLAHGFRAPPFEDANIGLDIPLFNIRAIPNPELRSETSAGWEAGLRWQGQRTELHLSAFRTDYDDFIETKVRIGTDPLSGRTLFQSQNVSKARIEGVEARLTHRLDTAFGGVTLHAAGYWAEGENLGGGTPLASVGPAEAIVGATWRSRDERTEVRALLTIADDGSRSSSAADALFEPDGYATADVYFNRLIGEHLTVRAGIGNLTDKLYWRWSDVNRLAADDPVLPTLAAAGRNYSLGLQWNW